MSQRNLHAAQELLEAIGEAPVSISCERVTSKPGWSGPESQAAGGCTHRQWLQVDPRALCLADREVDKSLTKGFLGNSSEG